MAINMGTAIAYLELDTSKFSKGFISAYNDLKVFGDKSATAEQKLKGAASAMGTVGGIMTKSVTVPLLGAGAASVKMASNFEQGMAEVKAISGATGEEFDKLTDKALEMGNKTKFSATDSADAFKYMAMAGWDASQMMDGIAGIMDLAAASGEDLAKTSDIVTDALTAFGLQASDSAHFADVLAQASSKSNTNVGLMGETFKYVAPVAGALGYSIEDTAVAIGLMANSGIKGSQAGTALRSTITRLAKPVGEAKDAVEELGISITDADGTMKPLSQTMVELREKFAGLTEEQKAQYAAMLAGQEGMSGLLAIVNASQEDFQKLTHEINNADGATEKMSDTMMNTLKGSLTLLKSNLETAGITIGNRLSPYIRKLAENISSLVTKFNSLSDAQLDSIVKWGGILVAIGPVLKVGSKLTSTITSIGSGVVKTGNMLYSFRAALKYASAGMSDMAMKTSGLYRGLTSVGSGLMSLANPITVTIALVGALAAATYLKIKADKEQVEELSKLSEENQKLVDSINAQKEAYDGIAEHREQTISSLDAEATRINNLYSELTTLVDANGRVQEGNEERVNYILGELSNALGQEITLTDGVINGYSELRTTVQETMKMQKAYALQQALQEDYAEAVKNKVDAQKQYNQALDAKIEKQREISNIEAQISKLESDYNSNLAKDAIIVNQYAEEHKELEQKLKGANNQLKELDGAVSDAESAMVGYNETIANYEGISSAIITGDANEISMALLKIEQGFVTAEVATRESLENQKEDIEEQYEEMIKALEAGVPGVTQEMVDQLKSLSDQANAELETYMNNQTELFASKFRILGIEAPQALIDAITEMSPEVQNEVTTMMDSLINGTGLKATELEKLFSDLGISAPTELYTQLESMQPSVQASALELLTQLQTAEASKRPEIIQQLKDLGIKIDDSLAEGITSNTPKVESASDGVGTKGRTAMQTALKARGDLEAPKIADITNAADVASRALGVLQATFSSRKLVAGVAVNGSHANGLDYVPYNGYVAELHEGERVLTKQQNREYNKGGTGKGGDTFNFYNTRPTPYEYARQMKKAKRDLEFGY